MKMLSWILFLLTGWTLCEKLSLCHGLEFEDDPLYYDEEKADSFEYSDPCKARKSHYYYYYYQYF